MLVCQQLRLVSGARLTRLATAGYGSPAARLGATVSSGMKARARTRTALLGSWRSARFLRVPGCFIPAITRRVCESVISISEALPGTHGTLSSAVVSLPATGMVLAFIRKGSRVVLNCRTGERPIALKAIRTTSRDGALFVWPKLNADTGLETSKQSSNDVEGMARPMRRSDLHGSLRLVDERPIRKLIVPTCGTGITARSKEPVSRSSSYRGGDLG